MKSYLETCPLVPKLVRKPGFCSLESCQKPLPPRRRRWCSDLCWKYYYHTVDSNHEWSTARQEALRRDGYRCVTCGASDKVPQELFDAVVGTPQEKWEQRDKLTRRYQLEVNHKIPRNGGGYQEGCHHHLENLEVLCHSCHLKVTAQQRKDRNNG